MFKNNKNFKNLKKKTWVLACHINEIKNKNDFKTIDYFDESIIIYNINNKFVAYKNVCPHRGSKIKVKKYGNEVFNCIYHGWTFNKDGQLISGPDINKAFSKIQLKDQKLLKIKIELCGSFLFVTDVSNKQTLNSYLSDHYKEIQKLSTKFGNLVSSKRYVWNCNWQIAIENSIDEYHGPILHKNTFRKILDLKPNYSYSSYVSEMNMPLQSNYLNFFSSVIKKQNFLISKKYKHFLIFPISTIATTMDLFCYLQRYIPINENNSIIETDIFIPEVRINKNNETKFLIDSAKKFNEEIFNEDKEICESINHNISNEYKFSVLGKFEERIKFFRKLTEKFGF